MSRPFLHDPSSPDPVPPGCRATVTRIHAILDGTAPPSPLVADPHTTVCGACRERARAARVLMSALAGMDDTIPMPAGLTNSILAGVRADRRSRTRRRAAALVGSLAAAIALIVWALPRGPGPVPPPEVAVIVPPQPVALAPTETAPPIRVADELEKAGGAIWASSRTLTDPADGATQVLALVPGTLRPPPVSPPVVAAEPITSSLAELPEAARTGLEPVTGSAQKAFARLLRDVGAMQPAKPKS